MAGRTCAAGFGVAAVALLVAGCADGVTDGVETCALDRPPYTRVDDRQCDEGRPGVGRYVMQLPPTSYDEDGVGDFTALVIPNVGSPLPMGVTGPRSGFVRSAPDARNPGQVLGVGRVQRVPAVSPGAGSTISRGGLGVSGYGGTGGGS